MAPDGFSSQAAYERRRAIAERVHASLYDYALLVESLDEEVRREIFEDFDREDFSLNTLESAVAFLYLGVGDAVESGDLVTPSFEDLIAEGVRQAFRQRDNTVRVDVDINIKTGGSLEHIEERVKSGDLSPSEAWKAWELAREGKMSFEEIQEYIQDDE